MEHFFNCHGEWALLGSIAGSVFYIKHWIKAKLNK